MTAFFGFSWLKPLFRTGSNQSRSKTPVRRKSNFVSLCAEALEDRLALSTVNVFYSDGTLALALPNDSSSPVTVGVSISSNNCSITLTGNSASFQDNLPSGFSSTNNTLSYTGTISNLNIGGPETTLEIAGADTYDTVTFVSATMPGTLTVNGGTINTSTSTSTINVPTVSLTSVNSLIFSTMGLAYQGSATINAAPATGQPFENCQYITGPEWGTYGYKAGDNIIYSVDNSANYNTSNYSTATIEAIIGTNMYLTTNPNDTTGPCNLILQPASESTTQITGATNLTLNVTGPGSSISAAIYANASITLNATSNNGSITILDTYNDAGLLLGNINAGSGTITLGANETIHMATPSAGSPQYNLTGGAINLISTSENADATSIAVNTQGGVPGQSLLLSAIVTCGALVGETSTAISINDTSPAGLTIGSLLAEQSGQEATINNNNVEYNSTPNSSSATYSVGGAGISISSIGPVTLNSISATGDVTVSGSSILQGNEQSANIITPEITLTATGTGSYQGQITFAQGSGGDTLSLPTTANSWSSYGFAIGNTIFIANALSSANNGIFTISSLSGNTLTLTQSFVLTPEIDNNVSVDNGIIGQASAPVSLSTAPLFSATTTNGSIYLNAGGSVNSTAVNVIANGRNGILNNVSVSSSAQFLIVQNITAGGLAAVSANSGSIINAGMNTDGGNGCISGSTVSVTSPYNLGTSSMPLYVNATYGIIANATATTRSSASIYINNEIDHHLSLIGASTFGGNVTINGMDNNATSLYLSFKNNVLTQNGDAMVTFSNTYNNGGSFGNVIIGSNVNTNKISAGIGSNGIAGAGQILVNSAGMIIGFGQSILLTAASGIGTSAAPISFLNVTTVDASTKTGNIYLANGGGGNSLTLTATTSAGNISVNWNGNIDLASVFSSNSGVVLSSVSAPGSVTLTASGNISCVDNSSISAGTLNLNSGGSIGSVDAPLLATSLGTLTLAMSATDNIYVKSNTSVNLTSALVDIGTVNISSIGNMDLQGDVEGGTFVNLTATGGNVTQSAEVVVQTNNFGKLTISANGIGTSTNVIQTNTTTINATANYGGIYLSNKSSDLLTLSAASVGTDTGATADNIKIYSAGNIQLQQQTTTLTQLATALPVAIFNPGGQLTLVAGQTLNSNGTTVTGSGNGLITSLSSTASATCNINPYGMVNSGVTIIKSGVGYQAAPQVTLSGGGGLGATATATINAQGQVTAITITNAGTGYTSAPTITITPPGDDIYTGTYSINGETSNSSTSSFSTLIIVSNTQEVIPPIPDGVPVVPALVTWADLTSSVYLAQQNNQTNIPIANGTEVLNFATHTVTITAGAITIDSLGQSGAPGNATIPAGWSLILVATDGPIVFLNPADTITTTGSGLINISAGNSSTSVASLGNLTTAGSSITISAGSNIAIGTLAAGKSASLGAIAVTSTSGFILSNNASTPNLTGSSIVLSQGSQPTSSNQSSALAQINATQVVAAANAAYSKAIAAEYAAGATASAQLAAANAFKSYIPNLQTKVTNDQNAYTNALTQVASCQTTLNSQFANVKNLATAVEAVEFFTGSLESQEAGLTLLGEIMFRVVTDPLGGPAVTIGHIPLEVAAFFGSTAAASNMSAISLNVVLDEAFQALMADLQDLIFAESTANQAFATWQAELVALTSLTAAYNVSMQAYKTSAQIYSTAQANTAQVQAQGVSNTALAFAGVVFASPSQPISATGSSALTIQNNNPSNGVLNITSNITANTSINLQAGPGGNQNNIRDNLTVTSGVTVQANEAPINLSAGNNVLVQAGSTISATNNVITITANTDANPNGATVTVAGSLLAQSVSIGVGANSTGNEIFNITPSATTPITVNGGSSTAGPNTLNFNAQGLSVTIAGNTIRAGNLAPLTFTNVQFVNITNASTLTLNGASGVANTMSLVGTGQQAGTATLNGIAYSFSNTIGFSYLGGGAGDTLAVTPFISAQSLPWNLTVSIGGGTGSPAILTYNAPDSYSDVIATGNYVGYVVNPGVAKVFFSNVNQVTLDYQDSPAVVMMPFLTLNFTNGIYTGNARPATAQVNGAASLDGITPKISYYSGTNLSPRYRLNSAPVNVGTYTAVANFAGNETWVNETITSRMTISKANQSINFTPLPSTVMIVPNKQFILSATGGKSGNPVVFTIDSASTPNAARISGNVLTILRPGVVIINANQSGNQNCFVANQVQQRMTINPGPASKVVISSTLATGTAGQLLPVISAMIQDQYGNKVTGSTASVTIAATIAGRPADFTTGSTITVRAVNGVATFSNLTLKSAGSTLLKVSSAGLIQGMKVFSITPAIRGKV